MREGGKEVGRIVHLSEGFDSRQAKQVSKMKRIERGGLLLEMDLTLDFNHSIWPRSKVPG